MDDRQIITRMTIKCMYDSLPKTAFIRVNRSFIVNKEKVDSFDHRDVFIKKNMKLQSAVPTMMTFFMKMMGEV